MEAERERSITAGEVANLALAAGFELIGWTPTGPAPHGADLERWLDSGYHGEMTYLADRRHERLHANHLSPIANSVLVFAVRYPSGAAPSRAHDASMGRFARYAWGDDYHDSVKPQLFALDAAIRDVTGRKALGKACVDTAPILERDFAAAARLGFIGRNTCLIRKGLGSWTFLAELLIPERIIEEPGLIAAGGGAIVNDPGRGSCGKCTRCLDACPTGALVAPYTLDARRCISYLTIELRGPIPRRLRPLMGNWVFGCDVCQEVCPYNRTASTSVSRMPALSEPTIRRMEDGMISLLDLLRMGESDFRLRFRGSPVMRANRRGLVRNACVAAGNSRDPGALADLRLLLSDAEVLLRGHAAWALGRIGGRQAIESLESSLQRETDPWVAEEMAAALAQLRDGRIIENDPQ